MASPAKFSYEVEIPGSGKFLVESATALTDQQAYQVADMQRLADPTTGMSGVDKFRAGFFKAFADLGRGGQKLASKVGLGDEKAVEADIEESRRRDAPLMNTGAGMAGNIGGNISAAVPAMFAPGANTYTGAALASGLLGALQPTTGNESITFNALTHAGGGLLGQAGGQVLGRMIHPVRTAPSAERAALVAEAERRGIPVTAGQATGSRPVQIAESVMENLPLTSGPQLAIKDAQRQAFTKAVLGTAGMPDDVATAATLGGTKKLLGQEFQTIAKRNVLDFNAPTFGNASLTDKLINIAATAEKKLTPDKATGIRNVLDDILSQVDNTGTMPGTNYQAWRGDLRLLGKGTDYEASVYQGMKKALDEAFTKQIPQAEAELWKKTSREYGNLKTIIDSMGGAGAGTKTGQIPPAQLEAALTRSVGREGKALGRGDLNKLSAVGRMFVDDSIPNSGTAQRLAMQSLLTGGGTGVGAGLAYATGNDPWKGALIGGGVAAGGLLSPRLIQAAMNSPAGQSYLTRGLMQLSPRQLELINASSRAGGLGLLGYASQQ